MIETDDWRLLNDVDYLQEEYLNPTNGEEIVLHAPDLKTCIFCWDQVRNDRHQWWFLPEDLSCCICETCFQDFKEMFRWKKLDGWDLDWTMWNSETIRQVITDPMTLSYGYFCRWGYWFTAIRNPPNVFDAIVLRHPADTCPKGSRPLSVTKRDLEAYISVIQKWGIDKAQIQAEQIDFLDRCPGLEHLSLYPVGENFDPEPLYRMPRVRSFYCRAGVVDYGRLHGLEYLQVVEETPAAFRKIQTLKTLSVSDCRAETVGELTVSSVMDTLDIRNSAVRTLDGLPPKLQCLYLSGNRRLADIRALDGVHGTLKALRIVNCPEIQDFSGIGALKSLEYLFLEGSQKLPDLSFLRELPNLKTLILNMEVADGDMTPCLGLQYVHCGRMRRHYNLKARDLPKGEFRRGDESIEPWRRLR